MKNILVLCTGNSCRSQIAHGYLDKILNNKGKIYSAGIETHGLNPYAVKIMNLDGININNHTSNLVDEYLEIDFDFIITVCDHANETCPYIPSKNAVKIHQNFEDPSKSNILEEDEKIQKYIQCRDKIKDYCKIFKLKYF